MRQRRLSSYGIIVAALGACCSPLAGCGSSGGGDDDSFTQPKDSGARGDGTTDEGGETGDGGADTGTAHDAGGADSTSPADTGASDGTVAEGGGEEAGTGDGSLGEASAEHDGAAEAGLDAAAEAQAEAGLDATAEASSDASNDAAETGASTDAGDAAADAALDSGSDASDSGPVDAGSDASDAAVEAGISFTNPVQILKGIPFNANTIVTTTTGGPALTPMDGTGGSDNNDFPTQNKASALNASGLGLANFGVYLSNGTTIPRVDLSWNDGNNTLNSVLASGSAATVFTVPIPTGAYQQLQIYVTAGNGASTLTYSISYATGAATEGTANIPDWCQPGTLPNGQFILGSAYRVHNGTTLDTSKLCNIYAINLNPDSTRAVTQLSFFDTGTATTFFIFYGATAW